MPSGPYHQAQRIKPDRHMINLPLSRESPIVLKDNGQSINDPIVMATQFNDHFCTVGSNMAESVERVTGKQLEDIYEQKVSDSIYLEPPITNEILNQITSLKNKAV